MLSSVIGQEERLYPIISSVNGYALRRSEEFEVFDHLSKWLQSCWMRCLPTTTTISSAMENRPASAINP